jgi:hypothetical protein
MLPAGVPPLPRGPLRNGLFVEPSRTPDLFRKLLIQPLSRVKIGLAKLRTGLKRKTAVLDESREARVVVVRLLVETLSQEVLPEVVLTLVAVRQVAIARVEALGQK